MRQPRAESPEWYVTLSRMEPPKKKEEEEEEDDGDGDGDDDDMKKKCVARGARLRAHLRTSPACFPSPRVCA